MKEGKEVYLQNKSLKARIKQVRDPNCSLEHGRSGHTRLSICRGPSFIAVMFLSLLSVVLVACETDTKVTIDGKVPPTFSLSGTGGLIMFRVVEAPAENQAFLDAPILWEIKPDDGLYGTSVSNLPSITYGKVPSGFTQTNPALGAPPALVEDKLYNGWAPTYNANGGGIWFTISRGKSVQAPRR